MKLEIKCRFTGKVLFEHDAENNTIRLTAEAAVKAGAYLAGANLAGANLARANLDGAKLQDASLLKGDRPIIQIGPIGSRCAYFGAYLTDKGIRLKAGCFFGSVAEFKKKLKAEHADNKHAVEYKAALKLIEAHAKIWMPSDENN